MPNFQLFGLMSTFCAHTLRKTPTRSSPCAASSAPGAGAEEEPIARESCSSTSGLIPTMITAPSSTPRTLPMPPTITMQSARIEIWKSKLPGSPELLSRLAPSPPESAASAAQVAKASIFVRSGGMPIARLASSSSRIESHARPTRLRSSARHPATTTTRIASSR